MNRIKIYAAALIAAGIFSGLLFAGPETGEKNMETRIRLTLQNGDAIIFGLDDNATSRKFLSLLPTTLSFEDYNRTEKVSSLATKLPTDGAPAGYKPETGDFCLYAPWGNLCIFYKGFPYSGGLVKLGHVIEGKDRLRDIEGRVIVEIIQ